MANFELAKQHFLEGCSCLEVEDYVQAEHHFQKSLEFLPDRPSTLTNLSVSKLKLKKYSEAKIFAEKVIELEGGNSEAFLNLGLIEKELKQLDSAFIFFEKALSLNASYAEAHSNIGNILHELKRYDQAITHYDKALALKPDYAEGWSNKGVTLHELKNYEEAIAHYEKALTLNPEIDWVYGDMVHAKMRISNWSGLQDDLAVIADQVLQGSKVSSPFPLLAVFNDPVLHKKSAETYVQEKYPFNGALGVIAKHPKREKIRIGYFSADFQNHPVAYLTAELFEIHDRSQFEVFAFSLMKAPANDDMNLRLQKGFDRFIEVQDLSDIEVAKLSRELGIDIAVDLSGPTQHSRMGIFAYRAAPIQVNWLGYPGTIGAEYMDYIIADSTIIPGSHQQFYVEKVVCLPTTYMVDDSKRVASSRVFTRKECGLPENAFVFCCFNNDYKFNSQVLDSWAKILHEAKNAVLWISENNAYFRVNLKSEFQSRGIDASRIIFAKRLELMEDHLARYRLADLFLDTFPYNAHTTAVDSLKSGVPVLTLLGESFAGRVAASLLNATGLPELIVNTLEKYEALALDLALNSSKLNALKARLLAQRATCPLFDTALFTHDLETAYMEMYTRYQADLGSEKILIV